jgi:hypothetical protein
MTGASEEIMTVCDVPFSLSVASARAVPPERTSISTTSAGANPSIEGAATQVFGISTDNTPSQREFAEKLKLTFPLLSDFANRATFVIDKQGRIQHIEEGGTALDPTGAETACSRLHHGK